MLAYLQQGRTCDPMRAGKRYLHILIPAIPELHSAEQNLPKHYDRIGPNLFRAVGQF
jgi:hypothetical protein